MRAGRRILLAQTLLFGAAGRWIELDQDLPLPDVLSIAHVNDPDDPRIERLDDLGMAARDQLPASHGDHVNPAHGGPSNRRDEHQDNDPHHGPTDRRWRRLLNLQGRGQEFAFSSARRRAAFPHTEAATVSRPLWRPWRWA